MSSAYVALVQAAGLLNVNPFSDVHNESDTASIRLQDVDIKVSAVECGSEVVVEFNYEGYSSFTIQTSSFAATDADKLAGMITEVCYKKLYSAPWVAHAALSKLPERIKVCDVKLVGKYGVDITLSEKSKGKKAGSLTLSIVSPKDSDIGNYTYAVCDTEDSIIGSMVRDSSLEKAIAGVTATVESAFDNWLKEVKQPIDPSEVLYELYQTLMKEASGDKERFRFERHSLKEFYILDNALDIRYALSLDPFTSSIMVYCQPLNEDSEHYKLVCMVDYADAELQQKVADLTINLPPF